MLEPWARFRSNAVVAVLVCLSLLSGCFILRDAPDPPASADVGDGDVADEADVVEPTCGDETCGAEEYCASTIECVPKSELGEACEVDLHCVNDLLCGPVVCQAGAEGDPCANGGDCGQAAPHCAPDAFCHDGSSGDPCRNPSQCIGRCRDGVCE